MKLDHVWEIKTIKEEFDTQRKRMIEQVETLSWEKQEFDLELKVLKQDKAKLTEDLKSQLQEVTENRDSLAEHIKQLE